VVGKYMRRHTTGLLTTYESVVAAYKHDQEQGNAGSTTPVVEAAEPTLAQLAKFLRSSTIRITVSLSTLEVEELYPESTQNLLGSMSLNCFANIATQLFPLDTEHYPVDRDNFATVLPRMHGAWWAEPYLVTCIEKEGKPKYVMSSDVVTLAEYNEDEKSWSTIKQHESIFNDANPRSNYVKVSTRTGEALVHKKTTNFVRTRSGRKAYIGLTDVVKLPDGSYDFRRNIVSFRNQATYTELYLPRNASKEERNNLLRLEVRAMVESAITSGNLLQSEIASSMVDATRNPLTGELRQLLRNSSSTQARTLAGLYKLTQAYDSYMDSLVEGSATAAALRSRSATFRCIWAGLVARELGIKLAEMLAEDVDNQHVNEASQQPVGHPDEAAPLGTSYTPVPLGTGRPLTGTGTATAVLRPYTFYTTVPTNGIVTETTVL